MSVQERERNEEGARHRFAVSIVCSVMACVAVWPAPASAQQGPTTPPAREVLKAAIDAAGKEGTATLARGATVSDRILELTNIGPYSVAVAFVTRPAGASTGTRASLSHDKITEIYYILRGAGTQVTGALQSDESDMVPVTGPGRRSRLLPNGRSTRLGPGDTQIVPPGVGHGWSAIDEGGIDYLVFRVDPEHVLKEQ